MFASWIALLYIAISSLAYSALDLLRKLLVDRLRPMPLLVLLTAGMLPPLAVWLAVAGLPEVGELYPAWALASVVLNVAANLLFLRAVQVSPLSLTIPFLSLTPVFAAVLSIPLLGEVPGPLQFGGIVAVVAGAMGLNLKSDEAASVRTLWRAFTGEPGSVMMTGVAFCWALAAPLDKMAMSLSSPPLHAVVLNAGVGVAVLVAIVVRGELPELRVPAGSWGLLALAAAASVLGLAFILLALTVAWVGLVETLKRAIGSLMALALGYRFFDEPVTRYKLLGVLLMIVGVALVVS